MKKYLVIYAAPVSARDQMANATPAQAKAGMAAWMAWMQTSGKSLVDGGAPVGHAARVSGGKATDSQTDIGGYSIVQAESREAVAALLKDHPHFMMPGGTIEVHEFMPLPGQ